MDLLPRDRSTLAGMLLAAMLVTAVAGELLGAVAPLWPGVAAWLAGALLWGRVATVLRVQAAALGVLGLLALGWAARRGGVVTAEVVLAANVPILAMLAAVSFLRLVGTAPGDGDERAARGRGRSCAR